MKNLLLIVSLLFSAFSIHAQNPLFDQQFRGFQVFFETTPFPNQPAQIAVRFPSCRRPLFLDSTAFPTETQLVGSDITLTYAFWVINTPICISTIERYALPTLQQGSYRITVNARLVDLGSVLVPPRLVETRTMAQLNFVVGEPLATQVPLLSPVGLALSCLMMLGVGAFVSGRRGF